MAKRDYQDWSREKLLHEYKQLLKRKKFGIVWEDKPEDVAERCRTSLPLLTIDNLIEKLDEYLATK